MASLPWIWTGLFGNSFNNALNWVVPVAPSSLSDCEINMTTTAITVLAGSETINSLSTSKNVTVSIFADAVFTLLGAPDLVISTGASNISGKVTLDVGAQLNLDGAFNVKGELDTAAGSDVLVDSMLANTGMLRQSGNLTFGDASHVGALDNAAGATWAMYGPSSNILNGSSAPGVITNEGRFFHLGGDSNIDITMRNNGDIEDLAGTMDFLNVDNNGTMAVANSIMSVEMVNGVGTLKIETNGTLNIFEGTTDGQTVQFYPSSSKIERLNLGSLSTFRGHIGGFVGTDVIDLQHVLADKESFSGGILTLTDNAMSVGQLHLDGPYTTSHFTLGSDGHSGTLIHFA